MDSEPSAGIAPGEVLAGKYRVERVLGAGGMGVVVAARHLQLDDLVALKFLLPEVLDNSDAVGRFAREARAAVKIKSEHVARVTDVGQLESGAPYMVMEYLEGQDLSRRLAEQGALPVEQAVEFLLQACEAIAEAHSYGIVHRDLKPANLFCIRRPDGTLSIKVLDFGISKLTNTTALASDLNMTRTACVMGSPLYMSPEQLKSTRDVDLRTDIWALGIILFQLVTGKVPFTGESLTALCLNITSQPTPSVRAVLLDASETLERVIGRCLAKEREARYRNVGELAAELGLLAPSRAKISVERILGIVRSSGMASLGESFAPRSDSGSTQGQSAELTVRQTGVAWDRSSTQSARSKTVFVAGAGLALVLAIGALWAAKERSFPALAKSAEPVTPQKTTPAVPHAPSVVPVPLVSVVPVMVDAAPSVAAGTAKATSRRSTANSPPTAKSAKTPTGTPKRRDVYSDME